MNVLHTARHIGIAGKSGMGKTTYALRYMAGSHHAKVFVFDHQGEVAARLNLPAAFSEDDIAAQIDAPGRFVIFDPSARWGGQFQDAFDWFCSVVYAVAAERLVRVKAGSLFVCDEVQKFVSQAYCPVEFKNIVETGRRQMLDTLSLSQRPNAVNASIREQWTELILFRLNDENSLKFAEGCGFDVARVQELPKHRFLYCNTITGEEREGEIRF